MHLSFSSNYTSPNTSNFKKKWIVNSFRREKNELTGIQTQNLKFKREQHLQLHYSFLWNIEADTVMRKHLFLSHLTSTSVLNILLQILR